MKYLKHFPAYSACLAYVLSVLVLFPSVAAAADVPTAAVLTPTAAVLITELQTGSSSTGRSDEFIELYNASDQPVDIAGWQIRYLNAGSNVAPTTVATLAPIASNGSLVLMSHSYFVLHTPSVIVPAGIQEQIYDAKLSNADKVVGLFKPDPVTCTYALQDAVGWGATARTEGTPLIVPASDKNAERYLQRYRDLAGRYIDTNTTSYDLRLMPASASEGATPGMANMATKSTVDAPTAYGQLPDLGSLPVAGCEVPVTSETDPTEDEDPIAEPSATDPPASGSGESDAPPADIDPGESGAASASPNGGLTAPRITEVLPNPASPQTDDHDEFIELYNENDQPFDLTGYTLEVGLTTKRRYVFPEGSMLAAGQYRAFFSAETGLSLSNSGSQVALLDVSGAIIATMPAYAAAKDGQAWVHIGDSWVWTSQPTPNAPNSLVAALAVKPATTTRAKAKTTKTVKTVKAAAVKTAKSKTSAKAAPAMTPLADVAPLRPVHATVLALVGVFAVLYGAYEYRHDLANYLQRFRPNRKAGREARSKS